jgi:hypothetical protein
MVTLDNEKDDRTVALPRRKGVRYLPGDRVFVHQLHGGDEVIGGIVSSKAGVDPAVDSNQIFASAIQRTHIASSAVGTNEIAKNVVDEQHFTPAFNTRLSNVDGPNGQLVQISEPGFRKTRRVSWTSTITSQAEPDMARDSLARSARRSPRQPLPTRTHRMSMTCSTAGRRLETAH